jgi:uncharacterized protein (TIGR02302 family)
LSQIPRAKEKKPKPSLLDAMARRAVGALLVERLLRLGAALGSIGLFFLALSWSGVWLDVGASWRIAGVSLFVLCAFVLIAREIRRGPPPRAEALARLDAADESGLRPASGLEDRLALEKPDAATAALWEAHRRRLAGALRKLRAPAPRPDLPRRDPYALRALALIAAATAAIAAGADRGPRLAAAFDWRSPGGAAAAARLDAWLDPPPYTGRAAIVLEEKDAGETLPAPVNSILRIHGGGGATEGALVEIKDAGGGDSNERRFALKGDARLSLPGLGAFAFAAIPDLAPTIELLDAPRNNFRGSMTLAFKTDDDYGVIEARALFSAPAGAPKPLFPPPQIALSPPQQQNGRGEAEATLDLADSPWAGGVATMTLAAKDEGGNEGRSEPVEVELPQRRFDDPLARALAEQRRLLVFDPSTSARTRLALDALSFEPELFETPSSVYLGLRLARRVLDRPQSEENLREVADLLWAIATGIEGDTSESERALRQARERLRDAVARGASEQEIAQLMQELRDAMAKFMEDASRAGAREKGQPAGETRMIDQQELERMLSELDAASKAGDTQRAAKLLDQLGEIFENLRGSGQARSSAAGRSLSEIDQLSREQQQLRDDTFQGRGQNGAGAGAERQRALRERLERALQALRRSGEGAPADLDEADEAMKDAERALGQGPMGSEKAVGAQGRALQALQRGADALAQQAEASQGGEGGKNGRDPLGRDLGRDGGPNGDKRLGPLGAAPAQRAHRVQEELRRRLDQRERPAEELDYLERLLKR